MSKKSVPPSGERTFTVVFYSVSLWLRRLEKSRKQHPTKQQLYNHLPPISKTLHIKRTRFGGYWRRGKDEFLSNVLLWASSHGHTSVGRPTRTYLKQLCTDTGCSLKDLSEARERDRDRERDRESEERGRGEKERERRKSVLAVRHEDDDISIYRVRWVKSHHFRLLILRINFIYLFMFPSAVKPTRVIWRVCEESSTMTPLIPLEIGKQHAVLF